MFGLKQITAAVGAIVLLSLASAAQASTIPCDFDDPLGYVQGSTACEQTIDPVVDNDAPRPDEVNEIGFFGESNWSWAGTINTDEDDDFPGLIEPEGGTLFGFTVTGTGMGGTSASIPRSMPAT
jgi:hypothetical protein